MAESVFGADPFEPVTHSRVSELIAEQSDVAVYSVPLSGTAPEGASGICVFDAETQQQLLEAGRALRESGRLRISAGSAGFGSVLPELLGLRHTAQAHPPLDERLLVICGSVNPITLEQTAAADEAGFAHWRLTPGQKLDARYWQNEEGVKTLEELRALLHASCALIIDSNDAGGNEPTARYANEKGLGIEDVRVGISTALGSILSALFTSPDLGTLLITGGDTLLQCMQQLGVTELEPICELYAGVVLSRFSYRDCSRYVLSKSSGFGQPTLLVDLREYLRRQ